MSESMRDPKQDATEAGAPKPEHATEIIRRKEDHIEHALSQGSQIPAQQGGFDAYQLIHQALPDCNLDQIDLSLSFCGKRLSAPLMIASMTGGLDKGAKINQNLALAAQRMGLAMGLGSLRVTHEHPETLKTFWVRDLAPDILLFGNLGAVQLNLGYDSQICESLLKNTGADGLFLHLNPLQEAIQPGGDTQFKGLIDKIARLCLELEAPVLVKECGNGISESVAFQLAQAGVHAVDVSGQGGTSWAWIEAQRTPEAGLKRLGESFGQWGIPTPLSLQYCKRAAPKLPLIASGGIRTGLDMAKAIALGAELCAVASPVLQAALESADAVVEVLELFVHELRIAMFCAGCQNLEELRNAEIIRL